MYRKYLLLLCLAFTIPSCTSQEQIQNNLNALFQHCQNHQLFNGHVLIYKKGEIIYNESFGNLNYNSSEPITEHTPFRLASLSKQFTAMSIVHLQLKGLLSYDDPVEKYWSEFPYAEITIRHLLNHTSGLPEYQDLLNKQYGKLEKAYKDDKALVTNATLSAMILERKPDLEFKPGTNFNYSNTGYVFLAQIVESITGKSFYQYFSELYFEPLGMENSWIVTEENIKPNKAVGYAFDFVSSSHNVNEVPEFIQVYGDGGIYSSANDLLKWFLALDEGKIMDVNALEEAYTKPTIGEEEAPYGFGWFVRELPFNKNKAVTHSGEFAGFSNSIFRNLDANTTAIVLSNNSHKIRAELNSAIVRILYGVPFDYPKISATMALSDLIISGNISKAKQFYRKHKVNELYDFSEQAFNRLGYQFLKSNKHTLAVEVFKWNVDNYPKSSNVYDSLGEAYLELGDHANALKYYSKAYEMDSNNKNAKKIIDRIQKK